MTMMINETDVNFDKDNYDAWMNIYNKHPIIVDRVMNTNEIDEARDWLRDRGIKFLVYRMCGSDSDIRFKFQSYNDAMLFRLGPV